MARDIFMKTKLSSAGICPCMFFHGRRDTNKKKPVLETGLKMVFEEMLFII